jgi:Gluconate 2-dehydrogenase subunit 3
VSAEGFTDGERECLCHLARTLLPSDEDAGADELGVAEVIEAKVLAAPNLLAAYRRGLVALDATSRRRHGHPFAALDAGQQAALVGDLQDGRDPEELWEGTGRRFFLLVRSDVVFVYATDPEVWAAIGFPGPSHGRGGYPDAEKLPHER